MMDALPVDDDGRTAGHVIAEHGAVLDVTFPEGGLPAIAAAVAKALDGHRA